MALQPITYKYVSTKEYHDAFPCAYRQWRADSHCNLIHGYSFSSSSLRKRVAEAESNKRKE